MDPLARFHRDGFAVLRGTFDPTLIARLDEEYARMADQHRDMGLVVGQDRLQLPLPVRLPFCDEAIVCRLTSLLETLLGKNFLVCVFGTVVADPGAPTQHVHRDHDLIYPLPLGGEIPCYALNLIVPLCDLDETTGTTALYPGSHRTDERFGIEPELPWLRRGDCLVVDYRLWHGGTPNLGTRPRPLLYVTYSRPWFFDNGNFYHHPPILLSPEDQRALPDRVRRIFRRAAIPWTKK